MRYQEFPPPPGLAGLVDCLWLAETRPPAGAEHADGPAAALLLPNSHRVLPENQTDIMWQDNEAAFLSA